MNCPTLNYGATLVIKYQHSTSLFMLRTVEKPFGRHDMYVLYRTSCDNEACNNEAELYIEVVI